MFTVKFAYKFVVNNLVDNNVSHIGSMIMNVFHMILNYQIQES